MHRFVRCVMMKLTNEFADFMYDMPYHMLQAHLFQKPGKPFPSQ